MTQSALTPAFPTFPTQNQFGQTIVFAGFVKLEIIALQLLPNILTHFAVPEDAMNEALQMAAKFIECTDKFIEDNTEKKPNLKIE